jgi:hypothetical protein
MAEEIFVPAILFGSIVGIVWLVSYFNSRKRNTIHETLRHAIDKGQVLSDDMMVRLSLANDPVRADLRRGVLFIAAGLAFAFLATMIGMEEGEAIRPMLGVAVFPVFLGLAYLGLWVSGRNERKA